MRTQQDLTFLESRLPSPPPLALSGTWLRGEDTGPSQSVLLDVRAWWVEKQPAFHPFQCIITPPPENTEAAGSLCSPMPSRCSVRADFYLMSPSQLVVTVKNRLESICQALFSWFKILHLSLVFRTLRNSNRWTFWCMGIIDFLTTCYSPCTSWWKNCGLVPHFPPNVYIHINTYEM